MCSLLFDARKETTLNYVHILVYVHNSKHGLSAALYSLCQATYPLTITVPNYNYRRWVRQYSLAATLFPRE